MAYKNLWLLRERRVWKPKSQRKTNRSSSATPTKQNKIKTRYKTKPKKKLDKNTCKHNKSQTQNKSFDSVGRTVERGFRIASSSYHSSLILLYIVIPFKLAESRRVWKYQRGNQNPYIEEEQTTQYPKVQITIYKTYI